MNIEIKNGVIPACKLEIARLGRVCREENGAYPGFNKWRRGLWENMKAAHKEFVEKALVIEIPLYQIVSKRLLNKEFGFLDKFAADNVREYTPDNFDPRDAATLLLAQKKIVDKPDRQVVFPMICPPAEDIQYLVVWTRSSQEPNLVSGRSYRVGKLTPEEAEKLISFLAQNSRMREIEREEETVPLLIIDGKENFIESIEEIKSMVKAMREVRVEEPLLLFDFTPLKLLRDQPEIRRVRLPSQPLYLPAQERERRSPAKSAVLVQPPMKSPSVSLATISLFRRSQADLLVEALPRDNQEELQIDKVSGSIHQEAFRVTDVVQAEVVAKTMVREASLEENVVEILNLERSEPLLQTDDISLRVAYQETLPKKVIEYFSADREEFFIPEIEIVPVKQEEQERISLPVAIVKEPEPLITKPQEAEEIFAVEEQEEIQLEEAQWPVVKLLAKVNLERQATQPIEPRIKGLDWLKPLAIEPEKDKPAKVKEVIKRFEKSTNREPRLAVFNWQISIPELTFGTKRLLADLGLAEPLTIFLRKPWVFNRFEQGENRLLQAIFLHSLSKIYALSPQSQIIFDSQGLPKVVTAKVIVPYKKRKIIRADEYQAVLTIDELLEWEEIFSWDFNFLFLPLSDEFSYNNIVDK